MRPSPPAAVPARVRVRPLGPLGAALWAALRAAALLAGGACAPALAGGVFGAPSRDPAFVTPPAAAAPASLHGCWVGSYAAPSFSRRGRVAVVFAGAPAGPAARGAAADGAAGWIMRAAPGGEPGCGPVPAAGAVRIPLRAADVRGGALSVRSEPYWDADCGCTLVLTLTARQVGDTLAGAFSARGAATAAAESRGRWRVVRAPGVGAAAVRAGSVARAAH